MPAKTHTNIHVPSGESVHAHCQVGSSINKYALFIFTAADEWDGMRPSKGSPFPRSRLHQKRHRTGINPSRTRREEPLAKSLIVLWRSDSDGTPSQPMAAPPDPLSQPIKRPPTPSTPPCCPCCTSEVARLGHATVEGLSKPFEVPSMPGSNLMTLMASHVAFSMPHGSPVRTLSPASHCLLADSSAVTMSFWCCV